VVFRTNLIDDLRREPILKIFKGEVRANYAAAENYAMDLMSNFSCISVL
jgi:hypothetical protein